ncbi:uncharacterized protein LOC127283885 [Leptopilina boulardi]|uniref:uncharacterized protein LOC127283885 n=1 Tax=Leptopilina boulardi TaxID=63433 RepID=UPI0021F62704|nr:uncharacterized protein LOC127283885 [Leptopilina boulardi]
MSGRGSLRGRRRIDARRLLRTREEDEASEVETWVAARSLTTRGRLPSEASSFDERDLDHMIQVIANTPTVRLTEEEEQYLPRLEGPPDVNRPSQAEPRAPPTSEECTTPRSREWCMEQVRQQIASKAKTPTYWGKTKFRRGRCGFCLQTGHNYHSCPKHYEKKN